MKKFIKLLSPNTAAILVVSFVFIFIIGFYAFAAWNPPTQDPIGGNTPTPLNVSTTGQIKEGGLTVANNSGVTYGLLIPNGSVGIGNIAPTAKLDVSGTANFSGTVTVGGGTGKINAGTVDPIYTINGQKYATFVAGMIGQKEEYSDTANLIGGKAVLDFKNSKEGSNLWLFSKTTSLKDNFSQMSVLLTPAFDGNVWYEKDYQNMRVIIYGSQDGEVSFRLTAPRFDWMLWDNFADEEEFDGFILN